MKLKQHLAADNLKELSYEDRITLLSMVLGLNKDYMKEEYDIGLKDEEIMLIEYGSKVNIGELMEIVQSYTGQFPIPTMRKGVFSLRMV